MFEPQGPPSTHGPMYWPLPCTVRVTLRATFALVQPLVLTLADLRFRCLLDLRRQRVVPVHPDGGLGRCSGKDAASDRVSPEEPPLHHASCSQSDSCPCQGDQRTCSR